MKTKLLGLVACMVLLGASPASYAQGTLPNALYYGFASSDDQSNPNENTTNSAGLVSASGNGVLGQALTTPAPSGPILSASGLPASGTPAVGALAVQDGNGLAVLDYYMEIQGPPGTVLTGVVGTLGSLSLTPSSGSFQNTVTATLSIAPQNISLGTQLNDLQAIQQLNSGLSVPGATTYQYTATYNQGGLNAASNFGGSSQSVQISNSQLSIDEANSQTYVTFAGQQLQVYQVPLPYSTSLLLTTNEIYTIEIAIEADTAVFLPYPWTTSSLVIADLDPNFFIDPSVPNASQYTIEYSPGIVATSATPLPAALPLFATGLGALGLLGWRRKRKNAAALAAV
jgi:hypothetical protein